MTPDYVNWRSLKSPVLLANWVTFWGNLVLLGQMASILLMIDREAELQSYTCLCIFCPPVTPPPSLNAIPLKTVSDPRRKTNQKSSKHKFNTQKKNHKERTMLYGSPQLIWFPRILEAQDEGGESCWSNLPLQLVNQPKT